MPDRVAARVRFRGRAPRGSVISFNKPHRDGKAGDRERRLGARLGHPAGLVAGTCDAADGPREELLARARAVGGATCRESSGLGVEYFRYEPEPPERPCEERPARASGDATVHLGAVGWLADPGHRTGGRRDEWSRGWRTAGWGRPAAKSGRAEPEARDFAGGGASRASRLEWSSPSACA